MLCEFLRAPARCIRARADFAHHQQANQNFRLAAAKHHHERVEHAARAHQRRQRLQVALKHAAREKLRQRQIFVVFRRVFVHATGCDFPRHGVM